MRKVLRLVVLLGFVAVATHGCSFPSYLLNNRADGVDGVTVSGVRRWFFRRFHERADPTVPLYDVEVHIDSLLIEIVQINYVCNGNDSIRCDAEEPNVVIRLSCQLQLAADIAPRGYDVFELTRLGQKTELADDYCVAFRQLNDDLVAYYLEIVDDYLPSHRRCETLLESIKTASIRAFPPLLLPVEHIAQIGPASKAPCPLTGGFTFKGFETNFTWTKSESLCSKETWRSSLLDSDCFKNEGLEFTFPKTACNIFGTNATSALLTCDRSWAKKGSNEIITLLHNAATTQLAQPLVSFWFLLTAPNADATAYNVTIEPALSAFVDDDSVAADFLSTSRQRDAAFRLPLRRRSPVRLCDDESADCDNLQSYCLTKPAHQFAAFCRRTCDRCTDEIPAEGPQPECDFNDAGIEGNWLVNGDGTQTFDVNVAGVIRLSRENNEPMACKTFDASAITQRYSLQKHFKNGCAPRQVCLEFWQLRNTYDTSPLRSVTMARQNTRSRTVNDVETLTDICRETVGPLEQSAVDFSLVSGAGVDESGLFRILLRQPLEPQKCGLYGFFVAVSFGNLERTVNAFRTSVAPQPSQIAALTDLSFTTCRHSDRFVLKNLDVLDATIAPARVFSERRYRCYGKFKLQTESDEEILIVVDETDTAKYYCAIFTPLSKSQLQSIFHQNASSQFKFSGAAHFVPIENCTFTSVGKLSSTVNAYDTWLYWNDVRYINNCQEGGRTQSGEAAQFRNVYSSVRAEMQELLAIQSDTPSTTTATTKLVMATTKRMVKTTNRDNRYKRPQAMPVRSSASAKTFTAFGAFAGFLLSLRTVLLTTL